LLVNNAAVYFRNFQVGIDLGADFNYVVFAPELVYE
jgi:hypothetical protein